MATFHEGFSNIKVNLIDFPEKIATKGTLFNEWGSESYEIPMTDKMEFLQTLIKGKTFPKFVLEGVRLNFCIQNISRICLAQLTRDNAIFCSESHGLRPLTMDFNIPMNLAQDKSIMDKLEQAQSLLEEAYIEACEKEMPYPETRYLGLHAQTINVNASFTLGSFKRCCFSRTNNSFCDELNYVYRKMFACVRDYVNKYTYMSERIIWDWILDGCIDDSFYTRTAVYNGDFACEECEVETPAHNDWRKSGWFIELKRIYEEEPYLLTPHEITLVEEKYNNKVLPTTYNPDEPRVAKNAIKEMPYYKEHKHERV